MENLPLVSIIIPCRNEEKFIGKCLDSIVVNDYPKDKIEVMVIDGMSTDNTKEIVREYAQKHSFIKLLENPKKIAPVALNMGVKRASGDIIMRMDAHAAYDNKHSTSEIIMGMGAHTTYEKDYISKCVKYLNQYEADNIGGTMITVPKENTVVGRAIAYVLSSPFGTGNSYFRIGSKKPRWVDTVFGGCYKREVFEKVGLFNENLARSQDMEFNLRLKKAGGKTLLIPDINCYYYAKADLKEFWEHNFDDGVWVTYPLKFGTRIFSWRHLAPLFFISGLILLTILSFLRPLFMGLLLFVIGLYAGVSIFFSVKIAKKEKDFRYLFLMPVVFTIRHIAYGLGSIWGLIKPVTHNNSI